MRTSRTIAFLLVWFVAALAQARPASFRISPESDSLNFNTRIGIATTRQITITNLTAYPLPIHLALSGSGTFTLSDSASFQLQAYDDREVTILFTPVMAGMSEARLTVASSTDTTLLTLKGKVVNDTIGRSHVRTAAEMHFVTQLNVQQCADLEIENEANTPIQITGYSMSGDTSEFHVPGFTMFQIPADSEGMLNVCFLPKTTTHGNAYATLTLTVVGTMDTTLNRTLSVNLVGTVNSEREDTSRFFVTEELDFENVPLGSQECQPITISNTTGTSIIVTSSSFVGDSTGFALGSTLPDTILAHSTGTISVCWTPDSLHMRLRNVLLLTYKGLNDTTIFGTLAVRLAGESEIADTTEENACIVVAHPGGVFGPILNGGSVTDSVQLFNTTNQTITILGVRIGTGDSAAFQLVGTLPVLIPSRQNVMLSFRFTPVPTSNQVRYTSRVFLNVSNSACGPISFQIGGVGLPIHDHDTNRVKVMDTVKGMIGIHGPTTFPCITDTVLFFNNTPHAITITGFKLEDTSRFNIVYYSMTLPATLQPGDSIGIGVRFCGHGHAGEVLETQLFMTTAQSFQSQSFLVQGIQTAPQSVRTAESAGIDVRISPNPTRGGIRVEMTDVRQADIQLMDILGHVVAQGRTDAVWTWDGSPTPTDGVYILRIQGVTNNGESFVESRQIVIER